MFYIDMRNAHNSVLVGCPTIDLLIKSLDLYNSGKSEYQKWDKFCYYQCGEKKYYLDIVEALEPLKKETQST